MNIKKLLLMILSILLVASIVFAGCERKKEYGREITVSFDLNFETSENPPSPIKVKTGKPYGALPTVSVEKPGCTFKGWNTRADGKGIDVNRNTNVRLTSEDHTLYGMWEGKGYTINYELNGGNINGLTSISSRKVVYGEMYGNFAIPSNPSLEGKLFKGWYTNPEGEGKSINMYSMVRIPEDHTLYAIFKDVRYYYDFSDLSEADDFYTRNSEVTFKIVQDGEKNYLEIKNESSYPIGYLVLPMKITAGTTVEYDVEFDGVVDPVEMEETDGVRKVKAGFFSYGANESGINWQSSDGGLGNPELESTPQDVKEWYWGQGVRNDTYQKARWNNGHLVFTANFLEDCYGIVMMMEFGRRKVDGEVDYDTNKELWVNNKWRINSIKINYAQPEEKLPDGTNVKVNFDLNYEDAEENPAPITVVTGSTYGELPSLKGRDGYDFLGWNTMQNGRGTFIEGPETVEASREEITLYAIWQGNLILVSYNLGGGNVNGNTSLDSKLVNCGITYGDISLPEVKKEGKIFLGWYLTPDGEGDPLTVTTTIKTITDHTIYAVFGDERDSYDFSDSLQYKYVKDVLGNLGISSVTEENNSYLKVTNTSNDPSGKIYIRGDLKKGSVVTISADFVGEIDDIYASQDGKVRAGLFIYGANEKGGNWTSNDGSLGNPDSPGTSEEIQKWYWGQGARNDSWENAIWNNGYLNFQAKILEDCYGICILLEFGNKKDDKGEIIKDKSLWENNEWHINSIEISYVKPPEPLADGSKINLNFELNYEDAGANPAQMIITAGQAYGTLPTPSNRDYYTFLGWNTEADGKGTFINGNDKVVSYESEMTLYAIWQGDLCEISYNLNGGKVGTNTSLDSVTKNCGTPYGDMLPVASKEGYVFLGWHLNPNGDGDVITSDSIITTTTDHTLYAVFGEVRYDFDFTDDLQAKYFKRFTGQLTYTSKTEGDSSYLEVSNKSNDPSGKITYSTFLKKGTIVTISADFVGTISEVNAPQEGKIKAGFFFYGLNENGSNWTDRDGKLGPAGDPGVSDEVNKWYWGQGARNDSWENAIWNNGHLYYQAKILEDCYGICILLEFGNLSGNDDSSVWENNIWRINSIEISKPIEPLADGTEISLNFDLNYENAGNNPSQITVIAGQNYGTLPTPSSREYYTFLGWNTEADGNGEFIESSDKVQVYTNEITLYGIWEGESCEISYELNGGKVGDDTSLTSVVTRCGLPYGNLVPYVEKEGYVFLGWHLNQDGSGDRIEKNTIITLNSDHTLYAIFGEAIYDFDFSDNTQGKYFRNFTENLTLKTVNDGDNNYLEVSNKSNSSSGRIVYSTYLKKGTIVTINADFVGTISAVNAPQEGKIKAGFFVYGANKNGVNWTSNDGVLGPAGAPGVSDEINKWYWGQGARNNSWENAIWNDGHISIQVKILENCYGISILLEFGNVDGGADKSLWENNKWLIKSIEITKPAEPLADGTSINLNFDLNYEGGVNPSSINVTAGQKYGTLPTPSSRDYYTFLGWNTDSDGSGEYITSEDTVVVYKADNTLYAIWLGDTCVVSYNLNGGKVNGESTLDSVNVNCGTKYGTILPEVEKEGYVFLGWYLNNNGSGSPVTSTTIITTTTDHTLYALFGETKSLYTFTDENDAKYIRSYEGNLTFNRVEDGDNSYLEVTNKSSSPQGKIFYKEELKKGTFVTVSADFVGTIDDINASQDGKLKAGLFIYGAKSDGDNWKSTDGNLGDPNDPNASKEIRNWYWGQGARNDSWENAIWNDGHLLIKIEILEDCYGINILLEFGKRTLSSGEVDNDKSLWENNKWKINFIKIDRPGESPALVTVNFNLGEGTVNGNSSINSKNVEFLGFYGEEIISITPEKEGKRFLGWSLDSNGNSDLITAKTVVNTSSSHTLYAIYKDATLVYDFSDNSQIEDFVSIDYAGFSIENGYLKVYSTNPSNNSVNFIFNTAPLKAGSKVEIDVEFVGNYDSENRAGFFAYGVDKDGKKITSGSLGTPGNEQPQWLNSWYWGNGHHTGEPASWWNNGVFTIEEQIYEDSYGLMFWVQLGNGGDNCYWKVKAIRVTYLGYNDKATISFNKNTNKTANNPAAITVNVGEAYGDLPTMDLSVYGLIFRGWNTKADGSGSVVTKDTVLSMAVDQTLYAMYYYTLYDFEDAAQLSNMDLISNIQLSVVEDYLKVSSVDGNEQNGEMKLYTGFLPAGSTVEIDLEYVGSYTDDRRAGFFGYGLDKDGKKITSGSAGTPGDGQPQDVNNWYWGTGHHSKEPNDAAWWNKGIFTLNEKVLEDCYGLFIWVQFGSNDGYWKVKGIRVTYYKEKEARTKYDFKTNDQLEDFKNESNSTYVIENGALKVSPINVDEYKSYLILNTSQLKVGSVVEFDVEYVGEYSDEHRAGIFGYGLGKDGKKIKTGTLGIPGDGQPQWLNNWYWGTGHHSKEANNESWWNNGKFTLKEVIYEESYGVYLMVEYGSLTGYWKITEIRVKYYEEKEQRSEYKFTSNDELEDFENLNNATYSIDNGVLKISPTDSSKLDCDMNLNTGLLKVGTVVEIEVEYVGEYSDEHRAGFFGYGLDSEKKRINSGALGDPNDSETPQSVKKWYWGTGHHSKEPNNESWWNNGVFTIKENILEESYGVNFWIQFGSATGYWKVKSIKIIPPTEE